ncbi:MAG: amino acid permease [Gemmatimonadota bacterium]
MPDSTAPEGLKKDLRLFDVYAVASGAMFSSGFFLLPGIALAEAGPAVVLAYLLSGLMMIPAMLSMAELSTAMPRAGGSYYFLTRSMGPAVGTVEGIGTWAAMVFKSGFALLGMGAYLALFVEVPMTALAVALTLLFTGVNIVGAKETGRLQAILVVVLLGVLGFFLVQGLAEVWSLGPVDIGRRQFTPFLPEGTEGLAATVALVFVSYAGLTKVASISEEVDDPDRNIPRGMALSLVTALIVYVVGVGIMVAVLDPEELSQDLTPVATAAATFFDWLPGSVGLYLIVAAAVAAFASTGNAGIMTASRYLLAMSRDRILPPAFSRLGRFQTPTVALLFTAGILIVSLLLLPVEDFAKLASAFQLILFSIINLAVVVMRESRIEGYDPGFESPLYPWMQIAGVLLPLWLVTKLGLFAVVFTGALILFGAIWYQRYAAERTAEREGAVLHLFERLGRQRDPSLDRELREIFLEDQTAKRDQFSELVAGAEVIDLVEAMEYEALVWRVAAELADVLPISASTLADGFMRETRTGFVPVANQVALPHLHVPAIRVSRLVLVRSPEPIPIPVSEPADASREIAGPVSAVFFLLSAEEAVRTHLNLLANLAARVDDPAFLRQWKAARNEQELKEAVLHDEHVFSLYLDGDVPFTELAGQEVREITLPGDVLIALVQRRGEVVIPHGRTRLEEGDRLTIVGDPDAIRELRRRFGR